MDYLTAFGLFSVTAMLVCYALERRSTWFIFGFAAACALGSLYGFLQGAWPFGLVEFVWAMVAARRWWLERQSVNATRSGGRGYEPVVIRKVTELPKEGPRCDSPRLRQLP